MKNLFKKTFGAVLSAITLSACVVMPTSDNQTSDKRSFVNAIIGDAAFQPYNGKVVTKTDPLNVRSGPGTNYKVLYSVPKGTPVAILEEKNGWGKVSDASGGQWVSLKYIQRISEAEARDLSKKPSTQTTTKPAAKTTVKTTTTTTTTKTTNINSRPLNCQYHCQSYVEFVKWCWPSRTIFFDYPPTQVMVRCKCCNQVETFNLPDCFNNPAFKNIEKEFYKNRDWKLMYDAAGIKQIWK